MRFNFATITTAALIISASAAPHKSHGKGHNGTDTDAQIGKGYGRGRYADGSFPSGAFGSRGLASPTDLPGYGSKPLNPVHTSALPSSVAGKFVGIARAKSDESDSDDSSQTSGSKDKPSDSKGSGSSSEDSKDEDDSSNGKTKVPGSGDDETSSDSKGKDNPSDSSKDKSSSEGSSDSDDEEASAGSGDEKSSSGSDSSDDEDSSSGSGSGSGSSSGGNSSGGSSSGGSSSGGSSNSTAPSTPSSGGSSASGTFPAAAGESTLSAPMEVTTFDGGMKRFGRGVACSSGEGGDSDAVFIVADGGTLSNVIIGADQKEGVHCAGACTIKNVWWEAVCEDALSFKGNGDGTVTGGGAKGAKDKVVQHNGVGTISISGFYVEDFGKLYRSCGNCKTQGERHVKIDGVKASGGSATFVGINSNFGDTATITNSCVTGTKVICQEFQGTSPGNEPKEISSGPSKSCIYTDADINAC